MGVKLFIIQAFMLI